MTKDSQLTLGVGLFLIWLVFASVNSSAADPMPLHAYEFQGNLEDSGPGEVDIEAEGGVVGSEYFEFDPMYPGDYIEGLTLRNIAVTNPEVYSIEMRIKYDRLRNETPPGTYGPDQSWIKTIDYTDSLYSYGLYVEDNIRWEGPGEEGIIEFIASTGTPGGFHYPGISPLSTILADTWFHVVVTRDSSGLFTCYVDGAEVFDFVDEQDDAVIDAPSRTLRFFQPDEQAILEYNVYEVTKGAVDYIRIYDEALSPDEAMGLFGPTLPGDYNADGVVNAADYAMWRDVLGSSVELANDAIGGEIGMEQYQNWRSNFGAAVAQSAHRHGVPEPSAIALFALSLFAIAGRRAPLA